MAALFEEFEQQQAARYPEAPGWKKRETSRAAAVAIAPRTKGLRELVLEEIRREPGTADEIAARLGLSVLSIRPRPTELAANGFITDSGIRRSNVSGKSAIVWRAL